MAGLIVGMPGLRLEGQEDRHPLVLGRVVQQQPAVLPDPVVTAKLAAVALVHVDVMDPVAGQKPEHLVAGGRLGPPPLPEPKDPGRRIGGGPFRPCCVGGGRASEQPDYWYETSSPRPAPAMRSAFAGFRFPPDVIVLAIRWYLRFALSYRDVEELLAERGIEVDHVTVYRWVRRFTPLLAEATRPCRHAVGDRWFVDETYVKVAGRWRYVYRAIDQFGQVIDVFVSPRRDVKAARRFLSRPSPRRRWPRWRWSPTEQRRTR
jgi:transposase, IS6 family